MKAAMHSHVAVERDTMFQRSADKVKSQLQTMVKDIEGLMGDKAHEVFMYMKRDYRAVLGGGDASQEGQMLPREQRLVRREIIAVIDGIEKIFRKVAGLPTGDDEEEDDDGQGDSRAGKDDEDSAPDSYDDEDDERAVKEEGGAMNTEREATPSAQLADEDDSPRPASSRKRQPNPTEQLVEADASDHEFELKLQSPEAKERMASLAQAKVEEGDGDSEATNASESCDSD